MGVSLVIDFSVSGPSTGNSNYCREGHQITSEAKLSKARMSNGQRHEPLCPACANEKVLNKVSVQCRLVDASCNIASVCQMPISQ